MRSELVHCYYLVSDEVAFFYLTLHLFVLVVLAVSVIRGFHFGAEPSI